MEGEREALRLGLGIRLDLDGEMGERGAVERRRGLGGDVGCGAPQGIGEPSA